MILPRKISFHGNIQGDIFFVEKVVLCYRCKTRIMLGENCNVVIPTTEDSGMYFTEQIGTPPPNQNPVQPDPSAEIHPCGEFPQQSSALSKEMDGDISSGEDSESDSDSELDSDSCSNSDSRNPPFSLRKKLYLRI